MIVIVVITTRVVDVHIHIAMDIDIGVPVYVDVSVSINVDIAIAGTDASEIGPGRRCYERYSYEGDDEELQPLSCLFDLIFHGVLSIEGSHGLPVNYLSSAAGRISIFAAPLGGVNTKVLSGIPFFSFQSEKMAVNWGAVASFL